MTENSLVPISPEHAFEIYIEEKRPEVARTTLQAHRYRLGHFLRWCGEEGIENLNTLTGRHLHEYKLWRRKEGNLKRVSVKTQMDTLRVFIRYCESIEAVMPDLSNKVLSPDLERGDNLSEKILEDDCAHQILDYLYRFEYASLPHVLFRLLWTTGMRIGAAHSLDVDDFHSEDRFLEIRHRPPTPLKNKEDGERLVALDPDTVEICNDWISHQRPDVLDEEGRTPLLATTHGRAGKSTLRKYVYRWSRPCAYTGECPHGRIQSDCEAANKVEKYTRCPSSIPPHAIRRGSITYHLSKEVPTEVVSERMNVTIPVLEKHYDKRSEKTKMDKRRRYLEGRNHSSKF